LDSLVARPGPDDGAGSGEIAHRRRAGGAPGGEVVKQEVASNVDVPYGGFPMVAMPGVLFTSFANAHDGYADFTDLDLATPDRLAALHHRHYGPANAVLAICGDVRTVRGQAA
jgi:zinc protease